MKISNFEATGLDEVEAFLQMAAVTEATLRDILKTCNIAFVAEGINRLQSMLLCELKASYVQQSQRYVVVAPDGYTLPMLEPQDEIKARALMDEALALYQEMTELKEKKPGRPKTENYRYGIAIEDGRYILPLAVKTNISVAMSGDKLLDLFRLLRDKRYQVIFEPMRQAMLDWLPPGLGEQLMALEFLYEDVGQTEAFYQKQLSVLSAEEPVQLFQAFENMIVKAGLGAMTSTMSKTPSEALADWGEAATEKARGVAKRVMGYGHDSVIEQARATLGMRFSLVTYHQQVRHRLSSNYRENLENLIDEERQMVVPPAIAQSVFAERFEALANRFAAFRKVIKQKYHDGQHLYFLLNCDPVKVIIGANARIENGMLSERICNNAQWEIRSLSVRKLGLLRQLSEELYKNALPPCVYGVCREGKLSCGRAAEMRQRYREAEQGE